MTYCWRSVQTKKEETKIHSTNYTDQYLRDLLGSVHTVALVGASPKPHRDSYRCMQSLLKHGYRVFPVNPRSAGQQILGQHCYAALADLPEPVDMVDIFRASDAALAVTQEAISIDAKVVWMQLAVINQQAATLAEAAGLTVVMDRCPKIELEK